MSNFLDGLSEAEMMVEVKKLHDELVAMKANQRNYLDYRKRRGRQTFTDQALERQQETLQKAIDMISKIRAEYQSP